MTKATHHNIPTAKSRAMWLLILALMFCAFAASAQDKRAVNNKRQINEMRAKSVKKKEKASTKDIAGKRLRTKNKNSTADRAIYSNPSPYADKKRSGGDRAAKGSSPRIRSRSAETARENVYPSSGSFTSGGRPGPSETGKAGKTQYTRSGKLSASRNVRFGGAKTSSPRSRSRSAESSRSNAYPQKGPYVNKASSDPGRRFSKSNSARSGRVSSNARITKSYNVKTRSNSQSAESARSKQFKQTGPYVNRSSKGSERAYVSQRGTTRTGKLSAGPVPPGKKKRIAPMSASKPFVTKKKKDVYWGKFSKGEKPFTTDISGNPLRRKNYRTPPNEVVQSKNPYEGRKKSKGDRAYSGTYKSGHVSASKKTEQAWKGDVSGAPIRKRSTRQGEVAGERMWSPNMATGFRARIMRGDFGRQRGIKPEKNGGGSISASGKYRTNAAFNGRGGIPVSVSGKVRDNKFRINGGGSISASARYRSNAPLRATAGSISSSGQYRKNAAFNGRGGIPMSVSGKVRDNKFRPNGGGSISASAKYRSNKPLSATAGSISETGDYRSNEPFRGRGIPLSVSGKKKLYDNKPKGNMSISGKLWNNNGKPIEVRVPKGEGALEVGYSGFIKQSFWKRPYEQNPNANPAALKKQKPMNTVYMADGLQVSVKAKQTATKPNAAKGSMPGAKPSRATVKASEYANSMKVYWNYKHNPSSADESQKTIAPSKSFVRASNYAGRTRLTKNYKHNPNSDKDALKVVAPGRAYARVADYQGNIKMSKYNDRKHFPDAKFAHGKKNNVKEERTIGMDIKLLWSKIFKKNETQPSSVKEKPTRPRYDKREKELWKDLYD